MTKIYHYDGATDLHVERDATEEEIADLNLAMLNTQAEMEAKATKVAEVAALKLATLEKLGITAEELAAALS